MTWKSITSAAALAGALASPLFAQQQPAAPPTLADIARAARKERKPTVKVYTNDNLPKDAVINVTGQVQPEKPAEAAAGAAVASPEADRKKVADAFQEKIAAGKKEIAQLERELDVMQRENKLRAASFYADAGTRLRDEKKYAEEDRKYQDDIAKKQEALTAARQKLDDLKESARRAGVPPGLIE